MLTVDEISIGHARLVQNSTIKERIPYAPQIIKDLAIGRVLKLRNGDQVVIENITKDMIVSRCKNGVIISHLFTGMYLSPNSTLTINPEKGITWSNHKFDALNIVKNSNGSFKSPSF
jgi:hypothetical protein